MGIKHNMLELFKNGSATKQPVEQNDTSGDEGEGGGGGKAHGMLGLFDTTKMANLVGRGVFKAQSIPTQFSTQLEPSTESGLAGLNADHSDSHATNKGSSQEGKSNRTGKSSSAVSATYQHSSTTFGEQASGLQSAFGYDVTLANSQSALGCTVAGSNLGRHHGNHNGAITQAGITGTTDSFSSATRANTTTTGKLFQSSIATAATQAQKNKVGTPVEVTTHYTAGLGNKVR
ncbi:hypothetical protein BH10PSE19_BH10PSE19_16690 [soil metagenome]